MGKRVLILNNRTMMRNIIVKTFNNNGYHVVGETRDVLGAVTACKRLKPDLVVIDAEMSYSQRMKAISLIYSNHAAAKIVLLSVLGPTVFIVDPVDQCFDDYMIERLPINHPLLIIEKEFSRSLNDYLGSSKHKTFRIPSRAG